MTIHRAMTRAAVFITGLLLTCPLVATAAPPGPERGPEHGPFGGPEWGGPPPFLMGLHLTEEQQDKVFAIVHAAAPAMRDQGKASRKAHEALRELGDSAQYDEGKAKGLAEVAAKADSQLMLLRARTQHDIYVLLTPEQRTQLTQKRREHGPGEPGPGEDRREHGGPPPG